MKILYGQLLALVMLCLSFQLSAQWQLSNNAVSIGLRKTAAILPSGKVFVGGTDTLSLSQNFGQTWLNYPLVINGAVPQLLNQINDVHFIDDMNAVAVVEDLVTRETIIRSTDGGLTWNTVLDTVPSTNILWTLKGVHFPTAQVGYAVGHPNHIYKTTNGGLSWNLVYSGTQNLYFNDVYFTNADTGVAVGDFGLAYTRNGGATWMFRTDSYLRNALAVHFPNDSVGYISTNDSKLVRIRAYNASLIGVMQITDNTSNADETPYYGLHFVNVDTGYVITSGTLYRTIDGCVNWDKYVLQSGGSFTDLQMTANGEGVISAATQNIYTTQGGTTPFVPLWRISAPSYNNGYCYNKPYTFNAIGAINWQYKWILNNVVVANTKSFTYSFNTTGSSTLKCIVNNGAVSDTQAITFNVNQPITIQPFSIVVTADSVCSGYPNPANLPGFYDGFNNTVSLSTTQAGVTYKLYKNGLLAGSLPHMSTYLGGKQLMVTAEMVTSCGTLYDTVYKTVYVEQIPSTNGLLAVEDSICTGDSITLKANASAVGFNYAFGIGNSTTPNYFTPPVAGSGGAIGVRYQLVNEGVFYVYVSIASPLGCEYRFSKRDTVARDSATALFGLIYNYYQVGDTIQLKNLSAGRTYTWSAPSQLNIINPAAILPTIIVQDTGIYPLQLVMQGSTGRCIDTITQLVSAHLLMPDLPITECYVGGVQTTEPNQYYDNILDQHIDKNNGIYTAGYYYDREYYARFHLIITKSDANGTLVWKKRMGIRFITEPGYTRMTANSINTNYRFSAATGITTDENLNVYICGKITSPSVWFDSLPPVNNVLGSLNAGQSFIAKFDSTGKCIWVYAGVSDNKRDFSDIEYMGNGRLLLGAIPYINVKYANGSFMGSGLIEIDTNGNYIRSYPYHVGADKKNTGFVYDASMGGEEVGLSPKLQYKNNSMYVHGIFTQLNGDTGNYKGNVFNYVSKVQNGSIVWSRKLGSMGWSNITGDHDKPEYLFKNFFSIDSGNNFYTIQAAAKPTVGLGSENDTIYFSNTDSIISTAPEWYVSKHSEAGTLLWYKKFKGYGAHYYLSDNNFHFYNAGTSALQLLCADNSLYIAGLFTNNLSGYNDRGLDYTMHSRSYPSTTPSYGNGYLQTCCLIKYNLDGDLVAGTKLDANRFRLMITDNCQQNIYLSTVFFDTTNYVTLYKISTNGVCTPTYCNTTPQVSNVANNSCNDTLNIECSGNIQYQPWHINPIRQAWAKYGSVSISSDTKLQYINTQASNTDTIYYTVCDVYNRCDTGLVSIQYNAIAHSMSATICYGNAYSFNNTTYTAAGSYAMQTLTAEGCDSVITLHLSVDTVTAHAAAIADTLYTSSTGGSYTWVDCNTNTVAGTGASLVAPYNGSFKLVESNGQCADTTACIDVLKTGILSIALNTVQVYPNPTTGMATVVMPYNEDAYEIEVYNALGLLEYKAQAQHNVYVLNLNALAPGTYTIFISSKGSHTVKRIVLTE